MFANYYQVTKKPVVIILDAETKSKLKEWEGFVEPDTLLDHVTSFVEEHEDANTQKKQRVEARMRGASAAGAAGGGAALSTTLSAPLAAMSASDSGGASGGGGGAAMTEEQELEAAIRASMAGGGDAAAAAAEESARAPTPVGLPELPPEPEESAEGVLTLAVRLPDGTRLQRRFDGARTLQDVFDFLHVEKSLAPGTISMVRPSPSFPPSFPGIALDMTWPTWFVCCRAGGIRGRTLRRATAANHSPRQGCKARKCSMSQPNESKRHRLRSTTDICSPTDLYDYRPCCLSRSCVSLLPSLFRRALG